MEKLIISNDIKLPADAVTETHCILAMRGKGKTHTGCVMAEEMLKLRIPVVIYDPMGVWWGLKSSHDGRKPAFPVAIFGGEHADVPLAHTAGRTVAEAIVENRYAAILDCSLMRKGNRVTFMADFLEALYHKNREAVHLFVDEVHTIAPQRLLEKGDVPRCLGAMEDVILQGRVRGIGATVISQRPAMVNTTVRTQCSTLIAMGMSGPHDIKAVMEWVQVHASDDEAETMLKSLPVLPKGDGWFWSPSAYGIFKRTHFRQRETFDSSRTPKVGEARRFPKALASPDLAKLGDAINATIQREKENNPAELKRQLAEARKQVQQLQNAAPAPAKVEKKEVYVLKDGQLDRAERLYQKIVKFFNGDIAGAIVALRELLDKQNSGIREIFAAIEKTRTPSPMRAKAPQPRPSPSPARPAPIAHERGDESDEDVSVGDGALRRVLSALAQRNGLTKQQISARAGVSTGSSTWGNNIRRARDAGWLIQQGDKFSITESGIKALGHYEPLPEGVELQRYWLNELGDSAAKKVLQSLIGVYPATLTKAELGERAGVSTVSSTWSNNIRYLSRLELISFEDGAFKASDELFN